MKILALTAFMFIQSAFATMECMTSENLEGFNAFKRHVSDRSYTVSGKYFEHKINKWDLLDSFKAGDLKFFQHNTDALRIVEVFCGKGQQCANSYLYKLEGMCLTDYAGEVVQVKSASWNRLKLATKTSSIEYEVNGRRISALETGIVEEIPYQLIVKGREN